MDENTSLTGLTLKDLLDAGLHFGHQTRRWNPKMKPYIFDKRNGIHIIDLTQTIVKIEEAAQFLRDVILSGKKVLFVATKKQAQDVVREAAESCGQFFMTERWLGGTLTNIQTIRKSIKRMRQIQTIAKNNNGQLSPFKKEASNLRRELDKLETNLTGIADMNQMPGALFVVDVCREKIAVQEANRLGIPVVAIVDSNANPDGIKCIVPGNDDAIRAIKLVADAFAKVIKTADEEWGRINAERMKEEEARKRAEADEAAAKRAKDGEDGDAPARPRRPRGGIDRRANARAAQEAVAAQAAAVEAANAAAAAAAAEAAPQA